MPFVAACPLEGAVSKVDADIRSVRELSAGGMVDDNGATGFVGAFTASGMLTTADWVCTAGAIVFNPCADPTDPVVTDLVLPSGLVLIAYRKLS